ncbi:MAG: chemotaxis protein CheW [Parvibaculum sp.]|nr:chemotaxis protein CheW [Parvibaculum sp.]|tara:strand:- start:15595 stop:16068 length:474 start_codon:yes stop_codon:yes gene_type:complete
MNAATNKDADNNGPTQDFVTMTVAGQAFGIPVLHVRDVLGPQRITRVPLAPPEIEGSLNLRGRIVTAVNMRQRLQLPKSDFPEKAMAVVVEYEDEPYSLLVDEVGEVLRLSDRQRDTNPATLDAKWRQIADGLYRLDGSLLIVLNIAAVLGAIRAEA